MGKVNFSKQDAWRNSPWLKSYELYDDGSKLDMGAYASIRLRAKAGADSENKTTEAWQVDYNATLSVATSGEITFKVPSTSMSTTGQFTVSAEYNDGSDTYTFYKHLLTVHPEVKNV